MCIVMHILMQLSVMQLSRLARAVPRLLPLFLEREVGTYLPWYRSSREELTKGGALKFHRNGSVVFTRKLLTKKVGRFLTT